jgi:hypothetical protein
MGCHFGLLMRQHLSQQRKAPIKGRDRKLQERYLPGNSNYSLKYHKPLRTTYFHTVFVHRPLPLLPLTLPAASFRQTRNLLTGIPAARPNLVASVPLEVVGRYIASGS